jgi:hypothetical protein
MAKLETGDRNAKMHHHGNAFTCEYKKIELDERNPMSTNRVCGHDHFVSCKSLKPPPRGKIRSHYDG